jgi:GTP-binding protein HflX
LKYVSPRLRESSAGGGRKRGSGAGESDLELDRRKIRDRLAELIEQLEDIQRDNDQRRSARRDLLRVALVGYTNAGKSSSLMQALTGSEVLVADKLFTTLDTTVRALQPETQPGVLVSDTVGFIKKLPHDLVASFRSTLAEALEASLLLLVVDASDPTYEAQLEVSRNVLREIGAEVVPSRLLLSKIDRVSEAGRAALRAKHPDAILLSAKSPEDVAALRETIVTFFEAAMVEDQLVLPYAKQGRLGDVYENARVLSEDYDATGRIMKVRGLPGAIARLRRALAGS